MVVAAFSMIDKVNQGNFFEDNFLLANISLKKVFEMLFLSLSNADIHFLD